MTSPFRINRSPLNRGRRLYSQQNNKTMLLKKSPFQQISFYPELTFQLKNQSPKHNNNKLIRIKTKSKDKQKAIRTEISSLQKLDNKYENVLNTHAISKQYSVLKVVPVQMDRLQPIPLTNIYQSRKQVLVMFQCNIKTRTNFNKTQYNDNHNILLSLLQNLITQNTSPFIRQYFDLISQGNLDNYYIHFQTSQQQQIKTSILNQRITILLISMHQMLSKLSEFYNILQNLLKCCINNKVIILTLIQNQINKQSSLYGANKNNKNRQIRNFKILKNNNDTILSLINKLILEEKNCFTLSVKKILKQKDEIGINKKFYELLQKFALMIHSNRMEDKIPFLAVSPNPYLLPSNKNTLVIDIISVMYNPQIQCFRPHSQVFLQQLNKYYQIVSFSAMLQKQMQPLIRFVDRNNYVSYKLYQQHCWKQKNKFKKDLLRLGRPLNTIILLDTQQSQSYSSNTIVLNKWKGNADDKVLQEISFFLSSIQINKNNICQAIMKYKQNRIRSKSRGSRRYQYSPNPK